MAKYVVGHGIDEYIAKLGNLSREAPHVCGKAVYEGAKVVADAVRRETEALPVESGRSRSYDWKDWGEGAEKIRGVTKTQKAGLLEGLGIAKMRNDGGYYNVSVGFHGYNKQAALGDYGRRDGQPNAMIARAVNSGTYFRQKDPFFDRAIRKSKPAAEAAMARTADQLINEIMK